MQTKFKLMIVLLCVGFSAMAQDQYLTAKSDTSDKVYFAKETYPVKTYTQKFKAKKPKNIILHGCVRFLRNCSTYPMF